MSRRNSVPPPAPCRRWLPSLLLALAAAPASAAEPIDRPADAASALLLSALEARGGGEPFWRLAEVRRSGVLLLPTADGERRIPISMRVQPPDRLFMETGAGDDFVRVVVEGERAWRIRGAGEPEELSGDERDRLRRLIRMDEAFMARNALSGVLRVEKPEPAGAGQVPPEMAVPAAAVGLRDPGGVGVRLVIPEDGGLPLRIDYRSEGPDGVERDMSDVYDEWRPIQGLLFPFKVTLFQSRRVHLVLLYDSIEIDLAATTGEPPPGGPSAAREPFGR